MYDCLLSLCKHHASIVSFSRCQVHIFLQTLESYTSIKLIRPWLWLQFPFSIVPIQVIVSYHEMLKAHAEWEQIGIMTAWCLLVKPDQPVCCESEGWSCITPTKWHYSLTHLKSHSLVNWTFLQPLKGLIIIINIFYCPKCILSMTFILCY